MKAANQKKLPPTVTRLIGKEVTEPTHQEPIIPAMVEPKYGHRVVPAHNNRRRTRGRIIQVVNMGTYERVIYHDPR